MTTTTETRPPFLTWDECADRGRERSLERLATSPDPDAADTARLYKAHKSFITDEEAFNDAWAAYKEALNRRDGISTRQLDWRLEYPDLIPQWNGPGELRQAEDDALQQAAQDADEALATLMWGPKWGTQ